MGKESLTPLLALGVMSGTSMDGMDIALLRTDGATQVARLGSQSAPYDAAFRFELQRGLADAKSLVRRDLRPGGLAGLEAALTEQAGRLVNDFLAQQGIDRGEIAVIGFHGHTVMHRPDAGMTVQIGDGARLAALTGIDVVYDMRAADVAQGGQGAPLAPAYHRAMVADLPERPVAMVNIGGVANVSYIAGDGSLLAFDTGPGNALIDDYMQWHTGMPFDENGDLAAAGTVDEARVADALRHPYFASVPPKSLDRDAFTLDVVRDMPAKDAVATLTALSARSIARAREHMATAPALWLVTGGGRLNRTLMTMLAECVENAVVPVEAVGFDGDSVEAEAWAYLAVRSLKGLALTFPGTTGVPDPLTGGVLVRAGAS